MESCQDLKSGSTVFSYEIYELLQKPTLQTPVDITTEKPPVFNLSPSYSTSTKEWKPTIKAIALNWH